MPLMATLKDTVYSITSCCFPNPTIQINGRTFKVIQLLGEGGFSFVYLVQDAPTGRLYALKKIRCPPGDQEAVTDAMREIDTYRMFQHDNIIKVLNTSITTDRDGTKIIYIFFPFYKRGNLQDNINANNLTKVQFPEQDLLRFFRRICYAIRELHSYRLPSVPMKNPEEEQHLVSTSLGAESDSMRPEQLVDSSVEPTMQAPQLYHQNAPSKPTETPGDLVPYAHRDLKPSNVLIADDGLTPVLMDFGSITRARIHVKTRKEALFQQDLAAEHSTMSYRAPELYNVQAGSDLDEKVDIWSLGCILYATAYGQNPFEATVQEVGGSLSLAILNGKYKFPTNDTYSQGLRNLIQSMLTIDPKERADIHTVIARLDTLLEASDQ